MKDTKKKLTRSLVAVTLVGVMAVPAYAFNSFPASKAAVAIGQIAALGTVTAMTSPGSTSGSLETDWIKVMQTFIKTANAKDLSFDLAAQCGLVTSTTVRSKGGSTDTSSARGKVRFRIRVVDVSSATNPNTDPGIELGFAFPSSKL